MEVRFPFKKQLQQTASILFWIFLWHVAAVSVNKNLLIPIPLPLETAVVFFKNCKNADFWSAVGVSILHITLGFLSGAVLGSLSGFFSGSSKFFRYLSSPLLHLIRSVPVAAFIILAWLWIPTNLLPSFISCLMVLPIVHIAVENGLFAVDPKLTEMARVMGLSATRTFFHIKLPAICPFLRIGCINGLGFAWKSGVAAEVICNPTGSIGALLSSSKSNIDYGQVFAVTLTIVFLSLLLENVIKFIWKEPKL